jgi:Fe2+ or Zn2+ uptake regulation protein
MSSHGERRTGERPADGARLVPELKCLFSTHGLRCTQQRRAIYEALVSTDSHPTAEELHQMIDGGGGLSLATVYNTLEAFCQAGLCQKLAAANGSCRYDGDISDHLHVKDAQTGRIRDVPEDLGQRLLSAIPPEVMAEIEQEMGMQVNRVHVELIGDETDKTRGDLLTNGVSRNGVQTS